MYNDIKNLSDFSQKVAFKAYIWIYTETLLQIYFLQKTIDSIAGIPFTISLWVQFLMIYKGASHYPLMTRYFP